MRPDPRSRSDLNFGNGQYLVWTIAGHVIFRTTRTAGINAILSGLFIDTGTGGSGASATYLRTDTTTQGT